MKKFDTFGTEAEPIRCSSIPYLLRCPARMAMLHVIAPDRESGPAADTGTAAHLGVSLWHKGKGVDELLKEVKARLPEFPLADLAEAEKFISRYTSDPRNAPETVIACELAVTATLPPHPTDPTGQMIYITGTMDQLRLDSQGYAVWDYKTGKADGYEMVHDFAPQVAAYALGAANAFKDHPVRVGGIIRARGYFTRGVAKSDLSPPGVFWETDTSLEDCAVIVNRLRVIVASIRRSEAIYGPGSLCGHCPHGGLGACISLGRGMGLTVV